MITYIEYGMPVYFFVHKQKMKSYHFSLHDTDESKEALLLKLNQSRELAKGIYYTIGVHGAMNILCDIADQKKMLLGQTMELEKLMKEGKGELEYYMCIKIL